MVLPQLIVKKKSIVHYLLIYLLIISQGSVLYNVNQDAFIVLVLLTSLYFFIFKRIKLEREFGLFISGLFVCLVCVSFFTDGSLSIASVLNVCSRFLLAYIAYNYDSGGFARRFVQMVTILALISLVMYTVQMINFDIIRSILPETSDTHQTFYGGFLFTATDYPHSKKNIGLATEPGRYQIYLIAALYICMYRNIMLNFSQKKIRNCFVILLITLITTQSTTGYISLMILIVGFLVRNLQKEKSSLSKSINRTMIAMIVVLIAYLFIAGDNNLLQKNLLNKLFDTNGNFDLSASTGASRVGSILTDLQIALKHPLGLGFEKYQALWRTSKIGNFLDVASCSGVTISLAALGFPATILILVFYLRNAARNLPSHLERIVLILILINLSLSQPSFYYAPMIVCFMIRNNKGRSAEIVKTYKPYT